MKLYLKSKIIIIFYALFLFTHAKASERTGTTGAQFLKIGVGARAIAMGEAFGAVADDINAIYWNPSGLTSIENSEASFMYTEWFQGVNYQFLGYAKRVQKLGMIGISCNYLTYGKIKRTKEDLATGTYLGYDGDFTASDLAVSLSYARKISNKLSLGMNAKIIYQKNEGEKATGYAADMGMQYAMPEDGLIVIPDKISISIHNIGNPMEFINEKNPLPLNIRLGAAYQLFNRSCNVGFDINIPTDNDINFNVGIEYIYKKIKNVEVAGRLGYKTATIKDINALSGLSVGFGFSWKGYGIDYAFVPYGDLGSTHRISILVRFK